jgi:hypothetical protein
MWVLIAFVRIRLNEWQVLSAQLARRMGDQSPSIAAPLLKIV